MGVMNALHMCMVILHAKHENDYFHSSRQSEAQVERSRIKGHIEKVHKPGHPGWKDRAAGS